MSLEDKRKGVGFAKNLENTAHWTKTKLETYCTSSICHPLFIKHLFSMCSVARKVMNTFAALGQIFALD